MPPIVKLPAPRGGLVQANCQLYISVTMWKESLWDDAGAYAWQDSLSSGRVALSREVL